MSFSSLRQATWPRLTPLKEARRWILGGHVQGVGFRPFVFRLANRYGLEGWVQNQLGQVEIRAQGSPFDLAAFGEDLIARKPALAKPEVLLVEERTPGAFDRFRILPSRESGQAAVRVPADQSVCDDCLAELNDAGDRRYRYPFINCTQCGPRYTLIECLPYDRPNTSMSGFALCRDCDAEYVNPVDRRFHAEPVACPRCGPGLRFHAGGETEIDDTPQALAACVDALRAGEIVAVKGVGGYHLMCDARNDATVARLRARKPRPDKPLAVMFPMTGEDGLAAVRREVGLRPEESTVLQDPGRPIVLARGLEGATVSAGIAPGLSEVGVMLPYSPLHYLLCRDFGAPLVATSGNISGEPVLTDQEDAQTRLGRVTPVFLHHDRPIVRPADDAVFRTIGNKLRPLRLGRGYAPVELRLPFSLARPVLAVGAHMKATIALAWEDRVVVSPHIGDMGTPRSLVVFEQHARDLQSLYGVAAATVVCDAHPGYATTRWAETSGLPVTKVYHHHAHASAVAGELGSSDGWLVFTWDGVGLGEDGSLWGGEALLGRPGGWQRVASLRPFSLPGGDNAGREPWRSALGLCWEAGHEWPNWRLDTRMLHHAWRRGLNSPRTTAAGRLFDAAAALIGVVQTASFEAQGPMQLEALCASAGETIDLPITMNAKGVWEANWEPLIPYLIDPAISIADRAAAFHTSMARTLLEQARRVREHHGVTRVGLGGGVFQNRALTDQVIAALERDGFSVYLPEQLPVNDAALSFGQVIEASGRQWH